MRTFSFAILRMSAFTLAALLAGWGTMASAAAQASDADAAVVTAATQTNAYVYLNVRNASQTGAETDGFSVAANGALAALPGSPYQASANFFDGVRGNDLFLSNPTNATIETYGIASDGALTLVTTNPVGSYPAGTSSEGPLSLSFDTAGKSIYPLWAENDGYQAFNIEQNGSLSYVDFANASQESSSWLSFTADDQYAYESACYQGTAVMEGYRRGTNGGLTLTWNPATPPDPSGAKYEECPYGAAVWGNQYVVIAEQQNNDMAPVGPVQMIVYTIDAKTGTLSTTNSVATAPTADVGGGISKYAFDPSGHWLAVGGAGSISIFSFQNGKLAKAGSYQLSVSTSDLAWDGAGQLIVYGSEYGKQGALNVFNVANGRPTRAPGSPLTVPYGGYLAVKSLR